VGAVWERLGRADLAKLEFVEAASLSGGGSAEQWKSAARKFLEDDSLRDRKGPR
jgi:hypothetical protein